MEVNRENVSFQKTFESAGMFASATPPRQIEGRILYRRVSVWLFNYCLLTLFRRNGFIDSNDRSVMLHHHFPQLISPFHDGFVRQGTSRNLCGQIPRRKPLPAIRQLLPRRRSAGAISSQMLRRVAAQTDVEGGLQFSVAFLSAAQHDERTAAQCSRATRDIVALDAVDIVGTVERYHEWLAPAQSFLATRFEGISLPVSHLNALVTERHRLPELAIVGAGARSERAITI